MFSERTYVKRGGNMCPACGGKEYTGGSVEIESSMATQELFCLNKECGAIWRDWYRLHGYTMIKVPMTAASSKRGCADMEKPVRVIVEVEGGNTDPEFIALERAIEEFKRNQ